ncbi:MAG: hypothetical protein J6Q85_01755 [Clostridia bacterium]|nr:hypothetical protein [Clostridia bacterium]
MRGEFDIVNTDVTVANVKRISHEQSLLEEARICELHELASDLIHSARDIFDEVEIHDVLSVISEIDFPLSKSPCDTSNERNRERVKEYLLQLASLDKVVFCELIHEIFNEKVKRVTEADFLKRDNPDNTFVYVKNPFADEAYDVFSQDYENSRVRYAHSFKEASRMISEGAVSFGLVPLEEKGGVRIHSVAQLIFEGDYKIISVTPVFGFDGSADMKYALISKNFVELSGAEGDDRYLEIRIPKDTETPLCEILFASEYFGHGIYRIGTISFDTESGPREFYSVVFRDGGEGFATLLSYLTLFCASYTAVGIYKNLE